jgi:hypothetical protein
MLRTLLDEHLGPRNVYLDVPLEESLERHARGPLRLVRANRRFLQRGRGRHLARSRAVP